MKQMVIDIFDYAFQTNDLFMMRKICSLCQNLFIPEDQGVNDGD